MKVPEPSAFTKRYAKEMPQACQISLKLLKWLLSVVWFSVEPGAT
ncbi:hypothetical protein [Paenibacillus harenae]|nr:hypothetical protein [Paenibacillus harenae]